MNSDPKFIEGFLWLCFIGGGFILGSIPFCYLLPKLMAGKDICALSDDHNPGAANVFINCGAPLGLFCLALDLLKGFAPVFLAWRTLGSDNILFAGVMLAPVLGHALGIFRGFRGGKGIAVTFGVMLGAMPVTPVGWLLAALYIIFSTLIKINPNRRRSIVTFALFALISAPLLIAHRKFSIAAGCMAIPVVVIYKHLKSARNEIPKTAPADTAADN